MNKIEFIGKLSLLEGFIVGFRKKIPYDLVVGIPAKEQGKFYPIYYIDRELVEKTEDFTPFYEVLHERIKLEKSTLKENLDNIERIKSK